MADGGEVIAKIIALLLKVTFSIVRCADCEIVRAAFLGQRSVAKLLHLKLETKNLKLLPLILKRRFEKP